MFIIAAVIKSQSVVLTACCIHFEGLEERERVCMRAPMGKCVTQKNTKKLCCVLTSSLHPHTTSLYITSSSW